MSRTLTETCHCQFNEPMYCGDCNGTQFGLTEQEAEDVRTALTFYIARGPKFPIEYTKNEMAKLDRKLLAMLKIHHRDQEDQRAHQEAQQTGIKKINSFYEDGSSRTTPRKRG